MKVNTCRLIKEMERGVGGGGRGGEEVEPRVVIRNGSPLTIVDCITLNAIVGPFETQAGNPWKSYHVKWKRKQVRRRGGSEEIQKNEFPSQAKTQSVPKNISLFLFLSSHFPFSLFTSPFLLVRATNSLQSLMNG